jgi:hypothetical protein
LIAFGPESLHAMRDPIVYRVHLLISEFKTPVFAPFTIASYVLPVAFALFFFVRRAGVLRRKEFVPVIFFSLLLLILFLFALWQKRWTGLFQVAWIVFAAAAVIHETRWLDSRNWLVFRPAFLALIAIPWLCNMAQPLIFPMGLIDNIELRNAIALYKELQPRIKNDHLNLLGSVNYGPLLYVWSGGRIHGVESLYWENKDGIRAAYEILGSIVPERSGQILSRRAIDFFYAQPAIFTPSYYAWIRYGSSDPEIVRQTTSEKIFQDHFPGVRLIAHLTTPGSPIQCLLYQWNP